MQSVLRRTASLSLKATPRPAASLPVRAFATHVVDAPFDPPTSYPRPSSSSNPAVPLPNNPRVVMPSNQLKVVKAPRFSKHSSRVKGRTVRRPRKATSPTERNATTGEYDPAVQGEVKIFLPSVFMRLVRNSGEHKDDPFIATFRTSLQLTKPDISNYLKNVYGLHVTSIRTINYLSKLKRNPIGGGYSRAGGTKNYKKVTVSMDEPFWYPDERSRAWCNEHFERDRMEEMRDRKMLKIGDGQKYGVGAQRYRGAGKSKAEKERLRLVNKEGGHDVNAKVEGDQVAQRRPTGLKKRKNVMRSREEAIADKREAVEREMEKLKAEGW
ncbi:hypothetical protein JCM10212_003595 [Sporobolomyces blumeae]